MSTLKVDATEAEVSRLQFFEHAPDVQAIRLAFNRTKALDPLEKFYRVVGQLQVRNNGAMVNREQLKAAAAMLNMSWEIAKKRCVRLQCCGVADVDPQQGIGLRNYYVAGNPSEEQDRAYRLQRAAAGRRSGEVRRRKTQVFEPVLKRTQKNSSVCNQEVFRDKDEPAFKYVSINTNPVQRSADTPQPEQIAEVEVGIVASEQKAVDNERKPDFEAWCRAMSERARKDREGRPGPSAPPPLTEDAEQGEAIARAIAPAIADDLPTFAHPSTRKPARRVVRVHGRDVRASNFDFSWQTRQGPTAEVDHVLVCERLGYGHDPDKIAEIAQCLEHFPTDASSLALGVRLTLDAMKRNPGRVRNPIAHAISTAHYQWNARRSA